MSSLRLILIAATFMVALAIPGVGAGLTGLARVDPQASFVRDADGGIEVVLALSQPVPWRVFTLDAPRRLVVDLSEVDWAGGVPVLGDRVGALRTGVLRPGWSRLVVDLNAPLAIETAALATGAPDGSARLTLRLAPVSEAEFAMRSSAADNAALVETPPVTREAAVPRATGTVRVVLDPGHGGFDPGAEVDGLNEAQLMLAFARELRELLLRTGGFEVVLTRDDNVFVPLETRLSIARAADADVFLSLHADALPEGAGHASGATVYTLSDEASDTASRQLAERHGGADLMSGVDLRGQGDEIALVLMEIARTETEPRTDRLVVHLLETIRAQVGRMNSRPHRSAAFSVLKSPDIPSVLIELGFLSSARDRQRLTSREWRAQMAAGIRDGLVAWAAGDGLLSRPAE